MTDAAIEDFRVRLLQKERELVTALAGFEDEARAAAEIDVRDHGDRATLEEETWESIEAARVASETLRDVRAALRRMENGTFGQCISCGRPIEFERLQVAPWTPFCREDQEKADARRPTPVGSTL